jgi:hypothetical protein
LKQLRALQISAAKEVKYMPMTKEFYWK